MKKRIPVDDLRIGMYVSELDRTELTPAAFRGFRVHTQTQIDKLKRYCRHVYIDVPERLPYPGSHRPAAGKWPTPRSFTTEEEKKLQFEILKLGATPSAAAQKYQDQTTIEQETGTLRPAYDALKVFVRKTMQNIRQGGGFDSDDVKKVVVPLVASAVRNADALVCFAQLRRKADYTTLHSVRVCLLALAFGRHLGVGIPDLITLGIGAVLHDIGKMFIPDELLHKPGPLSEPERDLARKHVQAGVQLLRRIERLPAPAIDVARYHHERYDGSGYPHQLRQNQIPYVGQIGGIVDCYDALTSDRAYASSISGYTALQKIYGARERDFDPKLVERFIQCMGIYPIGSVVELNSGDVGVVVSVNRVRRLKPRVRLVLRPDRSPHRPPKTVNLMQHTTDTGQAYEIEHVPEPGAYGIVAAEYLRVSGHN